MIKEISDDALEDCFQVIKISFQKTAEELNITKENCSGNSAFLTFDQLKNKVKDGLLLYGLWCDIAGLSVMIGCIGVSRTNQEHYKIKLLSILPSQQHQGYGKVLMKEVEKRVISMGGRILTLGMVFKNTKLLNWYEKQGFNVKKIKSYKSSMAIAFMEKIL